ncbi:MAG: iron-containing alcohol dehydrogenase [archaeon]|nr:iron-containing alcohol dehydrogenase [archaeon]
MKDFDISFPTEILFGSKQTKNVGVLIKKYKGTKILFAYGGGSIKQNGIFDLVVKCLKEQKIEFLELSGIRPNPRITSVRNGVEICKKNNLNFILAVGGGSVIDCCKAIAAGYYYDGDPQDLVLRKSKITNALSLGTILTLAATGSESNAGCVISSADEDEIKYKVPMSSPLLKPKFSILNPDYTKTVSAYQTAAGTADIMSHAFEQYFSSIKNTYLNDKLTEAVLKTCIKYCPVALKEPNNYIARSELMWASTIGLNGLLGAGKEGDWATHLIEHVLSAFYDITHGAGLAILTPYWMENILSDDTVDRFVSLAVNVWNIPNSDEKFSLAKEGIEKTQEFFKSIALPTHLREVNIKEDNLEILADTAVQPFGEIGNVKKLKKRDVLQILKAAF